MVGAMTFNLASCANKQSIEESSTIDEPGESQPTQEVETTQTPMPSDGEPSESTPTQKPTSTQTPTPTQETKPTQTPTSTPTQETKPTQTPTQTPTHTHSYIGGDCKTKSTCSICGQVGDYGDHSWTTTTSTIHHDEVGHYEQRVIGQEQVVVGYTKEVTYYCSECSFTTSSYDELDNHGWETDHWANAAKIEDVPMYETRDVVSNEWIVDSQAWDETISTTTCSICGATK